MIQKTKQQSTTLIVIRGRWYPDMKFFFPSLLSQSTELSQTSNFFWPDNESLSVRRKTIPQHYRMWYQDKFKKDRNFYENRMSENKCAEIRFLIQFFKQWTSTDIVQLRTDRPFLLRKKETRNLRQIFDDFLFALQICKNMMYVSCFICANLDFFAAMILRFIINLLICKQIPPYEL